MRTDWHRRGIAFKVVFVVVAVLIGALVGAASIKAFGADLPGRTAHKSIACSPVDPCSAAVKKHRHYRRGDYGHAPRHQGYPRHFVKLAKRAHVRWERHHSKVALTGRALDAKATTWWQGFTAHDDRCIAYYAARSKCPGGPKATEPWMKDVADVTLTCGGTALIAFMVTGGPADPASPVAAVGSGAGCFWAYVVHWSLW